MTRRKGGISTTPTILRGTVHGKTIELEAESGLPEGQQVMVTLEPASPQQTVRESPLEALQRAAGSWSDDPQGLGRFLEWNRQQRKINRRELPA
jgi:hypothetical protein